ncbi:MAG: immunity 26/phosphotriesterase HocA family protein [Oscillospiraceae bacterium]|nr:immunity 26/phosphotriesterase HocA family protein [Oscillospiraceae bacterium]
MIDKKALAVLKKSRKYNVVITDKEREICRENGVLWDKEPVSHGELIREIKEISKRVSLSRAVIGFLYSVSSGDYRYRTALSSLIWAMALPEHEVERYDPRWRTLHCGTCGCELSKESGKAVFDELKEHRTRLIPQKENIDICCAQYVLCDLEYFDGLPDVMWRDEDIRIIRRILGLACEVTSANKVSALLALIAAEDSITLTAADAYSILGVLSACGLFDTPEHKSFRSGFVPCCDRGFEYEKDIYYPLIYWRGKHGINYKAVEEVFGAEIAARISPETAIKGDVVRSTKKRTSASAAEEHFKDGEHFVDMTDRYRGYYGLSPLDTAWDKKVMYSVTHNIIKRTEIFFEGDVIKKFIYEELIPDRHKYYLECDTDAPTKGRELLLPKTDRGRPKNITPSLLQTPTYMKAHIMVKISLSDSDGGGVWSYNSSNDQQLPLPYGHIRSKEDYAEYTEGYIASLPSGYDEQIRMFIHKERRTVKFTAGDIFRIQTDVDRYTYCLILGKVRQLLKWEEVPKGHPLQNVMAQPILYRQYAIITKDPHMTAEELEKIPLLPMQIAQDNEVLWETYPIVCSKKLVKDDIDLGFMTDPRTRTVIWGLTVHTFDDETNDTIFGNEEDMPSALKGYDAASGRSFFTYGVGLSIRYESSADGNGIIPAEQTRCAPFMTIKGDTVQQRMIAILGLDPDAPQDDFAERYGGITREKYIELAEKRYKR